MQNSLPFAPRFSIWHLTAIWRPLRFFTSIASTEQRDRSKKGEPFCGRRLIPGHDMVCSAGIVTRSALPFPETEAFPLTRNLRRVVPGKVKRLLRPAFRSGNEPDAGNFAAAANVHVAFVNQDAEFRDRECQRTVGPAAPEVLPRREKRHDDLLPFPFPADGKMMLVNLPGFVSEPDRHGGGIGLHPEYEPVRFGKVEAPESRDIAAALREIAVQPESAAVFFKLACRPRKFRAGC